MRGLSVVTAKSVIALMIFEPPNVEMCKYMVATTRPVVMLGK